MNCRHCGTPLVHSFLDLGFAPPSNAYLSAEELFQPEVTYPLRLHVCDQCWLVQTEDFTSAHQLFNSDYAYLSSASSSWLAHAASYSQMIQTKLSLDKNSLVVEIASNDGYLLKNFVKAEIPCFGIEPTTSTAKIAESQGIPVIQQFFGLELAKQLTAQNKQADLIIGNNVYAHVPDINDFTQGLKTLLKTDGTITLEFPHLLKLIKECQFDTIYHEHFSYLSLHTANRIFKVHGLEIYDVELLATHGGSLRVYASHLGSRKIKASVKNVLEMEKEEGLLGLSIYKGFQKRVELIKCQLLQFLLACRENNENVIAYGAAAKGNTLLNYSGVKPDLLPLVVDIAKSKQGKYLPGSHIPIKSPDVLSEIHIDYLIILPWNIAPEITKQLSNGKVMNTKFVTFIPDFAVF